MEEYDPNRGQMNTWLINRLRKAGRWIAKNRNFARMGEGQFYAVGRYQNARSVLTDTLDREPTTLEVADHMGIPVQQVSKIEHGIRRTLPSSGWQYDPLVISPAKEVEALRNAIYEFTPEEMLVAESTWGLNGKPALKPGEIAKQHGWSPAKVSRLRTAVAGKVETFMK
jgi:hypothetical protein